MSIEEFIRHALSGGAFTRQWIILLCVFTIVIYRATSRRISWLPNLPTVWLLLFLTLKFASLSLPQEWDSFLAHPLDVAASIAIYCACIRISFSLTIELWYFWRKKTRVPKITRDLVLFVAYAIVFLILLRTRGGVNLMGLITTSAVLTAVIGLAAQNSLGNLFSGISIQIEQPFTIDDWIEYSSYTGKVVYIGWEAIHIKTFDDELIIIPNLDMAKSVVKNHSRPTIRHAMKIDVGVAYNVSPACVREALMEVCREEPRVLTYPPPVIRLMNYGDSAITYQLRFFYNDFGISPDLRPAMMERFWYALRRHGIKVPYPIRDISLRHIERRFEKTETQRLRAKALGQLANVPILKPLSDESRALLAEGLAVKNYGDDEIIVHQGDPGESLYILHSGSCNVEVSSGNRPASKIATLLPPAFFGEMSLLTGEPRSATVRAIGDTTVFAIDHAIFRDVLIAHPEVSEALALALAARQAETEGVVDRQREEDTSSRASQFLTMIKSFFGI